MCFIFENGNFVFYKSHETCFGGYPPRTSKKHRNRNFEFHIIAKTTKNSETLKIMKIRTTPRPAHPSRGGAPPEGRREILIISRIRRRTRLMSLDCTKKPTVQMVIKTTARCFGLRFSSVVGVIQGRGVPAVCLSVIEREAGHRAARVRDEVPGPHVRGEPVDPGPLPGASLRRSPARTKINSPYSVRRCAVQFRRRKINSPYPVRC